MFSEPREAISMMNLCDLHDEQWFSMSEITINNESIMEFTIDLEERGTNLTQTVLLDKENGLVITDVPAHNDIDPSTSYHDEELVSTIIFIGVLPMYKSGPISKPPLYFYDLFLS